METGYRLIVVRMLVYQHDFNSDVMCVRVAHGNVLVELFCCLLFCSIFFFFSLAKALPIRVDTYVSIHQRRRFVWQRTRHT